MAKLKKLMSKEAMEKMIVEGTIGISAQEKAMLQRICNRKHDETCIPNTREGLHRVLTGLVEVLAPGRRTSA